MSLQTIKKKRIVVSECFVIKITILSFKFGNLIEMNRACELSFPCRMHLEIRQYLCAKAYAHVYLQVHTVQVCLSMCVFTKCQRTTLAESSWFPLWMTNAFTSHSTGCCSAGLPHKHTHKHTETPWMHKILYWKHLSGVEFQLHTHRINKL